MTKAHILVRLWTDGAARVRTPCGVPEWYGLRCARLVAIAAADMTQPSHAKHPPTSSTHAPMHGHGLIRARRMGDRRPEGGPRSHAAALPFLLCAHSTEERERERERERKRERERGHICDRERRSEHKREGQAHTHAHTPCGGAHPKPPRGANGATGELLPSFRGHSAGARAPLLHTLSTAMLSPLCREGLCRHQRVGIDTVTRRLQGGHGHYNA